MIVPMGDKYLVEVIEAQAVTTGGIIIPDQAQEEKSEGIIKAVGTGKLTEDRRVVPLRLAAGDKIIFGKYSGDEISVDGKKHRILKEAEVLAVYA